MFIPRFFCATPLCVDSRLLLDKKLTHHAIQVLRLTAGAHIILFNGLGGEYVAVLEKEENKFYAQISAHYSPNTELAGEVILVQALATNEKMDWIIEKSVELGVHQIIPIAAERSLLKLSETRLEKRLIHWQSVIQAASEQCGRNLIPKIAAPQSLEAWLKHSFEGLHLLCHPQADKGLAETIESHLNIQRLVLMIGPEAGWSATELSMAQHYGVKSIRFGTRILRTETAGIALVAASSALLKWNY